MEGAKKSTRLNETTTTTSMTMRTGVKIRDRMKRMLWEEEEGKFGGGK